MSKAAAATKRAPVKKAAKQPRTAAKKVAPKKQGPPAGAKRLRFTPSYKQHLAWQLLEDAVKEEIVYGGAAGGGKSWLGACWKIYRRLRYPNSRGLVGRTVFNDLKESTLITFFEVLSHWGMVAGKDYLYHGTDHYIQFANGSREVFKALGWQPSDPDYQRLGSTEFTDLWIEEAGDGMPQKAMQIAKSRIRWKLDEFDLIPKVLITCNPGYHWIRTAYFYDDEDNPVVLKPHQAVVRALVTDNPKPEFVKRYKKNLEGLSDYDRARLLEGDWNAVEKSGGEFYHAFDTEKHSGDYAKRYDDELPLHITLDFNTAPYMTLNVWQIFEVEPGQFEAVQLDEFTPSSPDNNTPAVMRLFVAKYGDHEAEVFVYGDPAGKHADTRSEKGHNDFTLVLNALEGMPQVTKRVGLAAPSVSMRGLWQNAIFSGEQPALKILISKNCRNTLQDYQKVKKGADGAKEKRRVKDATTGISYEPYGHCSDANDYFLCKAFDRHYKEFKNRKRKPNTGKAEQALNPNYTPAESAERARPERPARRPRSSKNRY
jgi:phage terminase large subunit